MNLPHLSEALSLFLWSRHVHMLERIGIDVYRIRIGIHLEGIALLCWWNGHVYMDWVVSIEFSRVEKAFRQQLVRELVEICSDCNLAEESMAVVLALRYLVSGDVVNVVESLVGLYEQSLADRTCVHGVH